MAYTKTDKGLYPAAGAIYTRSKSKQGAGIANIEQTTASAADGGVNVVAITLETGEKYTFEVRNGNRGRPGATGQDGVPGAPGTAGADGNGIESAILNDDYTLTLVFTDGTRYTTPSIRGLPGAKGADGAQGPKGETGPQGPKGDTGTFDDSALANYALKADIAATKFNSTSQGTVSYFKIHDFGAWGTGAWYQKGFSMLITSRAGETVWLSVSANDSNTTARAIRLMNTYSKIAAVYYSASESAVYVKANAWVNNICAHILSNVYGDYVPTVSVVSGLASDVVEVNIVEFGPTSSGLALGGPSTALLLGGSADRPTYNGNDLALKSDITAGGNVDLSAYLPKSGGTLTGDLSVAGAASMDTNGYVTGTWLRSTADTSLGSTPTEGICVKQNGWIYTRTPSQILSDIGAAPAASMGSYLPLAGGTMSGTVMQQVAGNPYFGLNDGTTNWYLQASQSEGKCGLGPTWTSATKWDASGNMSVAGSMTASGNISATGALKGSGGAYISGRAMGGGDDEGIVIGRASNNYAGLTLGDAAGVRSVMYLMPDNSAVWRYNNGSASYDIQHPGKAGTIALTSDLGRTTAVNAADSNYTTLMARGSSLNSTVTNPGVNGAIAWTYE